MWWVCVCVRVRAHGTADGGFMLAATKFHQPNGEAHLISPYILAGHDTCMKFYYQLRGGILNIRVRHQAGKLETVWSRR